MFIVVVIVSCVSLWCRSVSLLSTSLILLRLIPYLMSDTWADVARSFKSLRSATEPTGSLDYLRPRPQSASRPSSAFVALHLAAPSNSSLHHHHHNHHDASGTDDEDEDDGDFLGDDESDDSGDDRAAGVGGGACGGHRAQRTDLTAGSDDEDEEIGPGHEGETDPARRRVAKGTSEADEERLEEILEADLQDTEDVVVLFADQYPKLRHTFEALVQGYNTSLVVSNEGPSAPERDGIDPVDNLADKILQRMTERGKGTIEEREKAEEAFRLKAVKKSTYKLNASVHGYEAEIRGDLTSTIHGKRAKKLVEDESIDAVVRESRTCCAKHCLHSWKMAVKDRAREVIKTERVSYGRMTPRGRVEKFMAFVEKLLKKKEETDGEETIITGE